jgi:hypothetical protein
MKGRAVNARRKISDDAAIKEVATLRGEIAFGFSATTDGGRDCWDGPGHRPSRLADAMCEWRDRRSRCSLFFRCQAGQASVTMVFHHLEAISLNHALQRTAGAFASGQGKEAAPRVPPRTRAKAQGDGSYTGLSVHATRPARPCRRSGNPRRGFPTVGRQSPQRPAIAEVQFVRRILHDHL